MLNCQITFGNQMVAVSDPKIFGQIVIIFDMDFKTTN